VEAQDGGSCSRQGTLGGCRPEYKACCYVEGRLEKVKKKGEEYYLYLSLRFDIAKCHWRIYNKEVVGKHRELASIKFISCFYKRSCFILG